MVYVSRSPTPTACETRISSAVEDSYRAAAEALAEADTCLDDLRRRDG
jgi:hypothetical protein